MEYRVKNLADLGRIVTGRTPKTAESGNFGGNIPFVTPTDMDGRKRITATERYLSDGGANSVSTARIPAGAIMVSCIGSDMGKVALAGSECVTNQQINSLILDDGIDAEYVYYDLSTRKVELQSLAGGGSAQPILNKGHFGQIKIRLPPLDGQRIIGRILRGLDDKIDLNRRMNETLEDMARAIFKSWFVDFDPVRAKAEGRQSAGMDAETAALFPAEFDNEAKNPVPQGWFLSEIRDQATRIQYGFTQSASSEQVGPQFLRITDIQQGRVDWSRVPFCTASPTELEKYRIRAGDILVARTGASTGENIYIIDAPEAVFASYLVRFEFADAAIARVVGEFMRTDAYFDYIANAVGGSAQPNASAQVLGGAEFAFPPIQIARRFHEIVGPMDSLRACLMKESETLSLIRDSLLPKLLSGELQVNL